MQHYFLFNPILNIHDIRYLVYLDILTYFMFPSDVDECSSSPCFNAVECNDAINSYTCDCVPGYVGDHCQTGNSMFFSFMFHTQINNRKMHIITTKKFQIQTSQHKIQGLMDILNIISIQVPSAHCGNAIWKLCVLSKNYVYCKKCRLRKVCKFVLLSCCLRPTNYWLV